MHRDVGTSYIDYAAAFDSVSHKFLDAALAKAGESRKTRKTFRSIYEVTAGTVRINGTNGSHVYADRFNVVRGVIQVDIISPILFILALDQLAQTHDTHGTGYKCSELLTIRILGYADDAALIDPRTEDMTRRLTTLADASWREADMKVRMDKTFSHHVCRRAATTVTTEEAIAVQVKFKYK